MTQPHHSASAVRLLEQLQRSQAWRNEAVETGDRPGPPPGRRRRRERGSAAGS